MNNHQSHNFKRFMQKIVQAKFCILYYNKINTKKYKINTK